MGMLRHYNSDNIPDDINTHDRAIPISHNIAITSTHNIPPQQCTITPPNQRTNLDANNT